MWLQELFSKQKGFLEEELDYRKQALDQAYMVRSLEQYELSLNTMPILSHKKNAPIFIYYTIKQGCLQGVMAHKKMIQEFSAATLSFQHDT